MLRKNLSIFGQILFMAHDESILAPFPPTYCSLVQIPGTQLNPHLHLLCSLLLISISQMNSSLQLLPPTCCSLVQFQRIQGNPSQHLLPPNLNVALRRFPESRWIVNPPRHLQLSTYCSLAVSQDPETPIPALSLPAWCGLAQFSPTSMNSSLHLLLPCLLWPGVVFQNPGESIPEPPSSQPLWPGAISKGSRWIHLCTFSLPSCFGLVKFPRSWVIPSLRFPPPYLLWPGAVSQDPGEPVLALAETVYALLPHWTFWPSPPVKIVVVIIAVGSCGAGDVYVVDVCCGAGSIWRADIISS